jgi:hypothetical protein
MEVILSPSTSDFAGNVFPINPRGTERHQRRRKNVQNVRIYAGEVELIRKSENSLREFLFVNRRALDSKSERDEIGTIHRKTIMTLHQAQLHGRIFFIVWMRGKPISNAEKGASGRIGTEPTDGYIPPVLEWAAMTFHSSPNF